MVSHPYKSDWLKIQCQVSKDDALYLSTKSEYPLLDGELLNFSMHEGQYVQAEVCINKLDAERLIKHLSKAFNLPLAA